jgi:hypothetical protein
MRLTSARAPADWLHLLRGESANPFRASAPSPVHAHLMRHEFRFASPMDHDRRDRLTMVGKPRLGVDAGTLLCDTAAWPGT